MKGIIFPLWIVIPILSKLVFAFTTKKVCRGSLLTNKKHHHGLQRIRNRIFRFHQEKKVWNSNCFHKIISIPRLGKSLCWTWEVSSLLCPRRLSMSHQHVLLDLLLPICYIQLHHTIQRDWCSWKGKNWGRYKICTISNNDCCTV